MQIKIIENLFELWRALKQLLLILWQPVGKDLIRLGKLLFQGMPMKVVEAEIVIIWNSHSANRNLRKNKEAMRKIKFLELYLKGRKNQGQNQES